MIRKDIDGLYSIALKPCTCTVLKGLLEPRGYVWLRGHTPDTFIHWWRATVPITATDYLKDAEVRLLAYDLQMPTDQFLGTLHRFEQHGISLVQLQGRVPNTLWLDRIEERARTKVLLKNGLISTFYLPHAHEVAVYRAVNPDTLQTIIKRPEVSQFVMA